MYSAEWERSREDSNCMLEDGSEILGYNMSSASKDDDTDYFNIEVDSLKVAFACAWMRRYVQKMYSAEWEKSREDSNCMLEDGSEILGYNIKLKKNMLMKSSQVKMMTQTQSQKLFVPSLIGNYK